LTYAAESSRTTHGAAECLDACHLLGDILYRALSGANKADCLFSTSPECLASPAIQAIARGEYRDKAAQQIKGSGYVVASLEATLWCFWTTETYEAAILAAVICGQVAAAFYGEQGIAVHWRETLVMRNEIIHLADQLTTKDTCDTSYRREHKG
jgi:ADP-ribosyl-[dinitrogen reductase] hydrolase